MTQADSNPSDSQLMAAVQAGSRGRFAVLVGRYQADLLRVAESRLGRRDWAEDVVQETFLAAFKSRMSFDPAASFRTWLWTILLNQCHRHFRRRQRRPRVDGWTATANADQPAPENDVACLQPSPPVQLWAKERKALLENVLRQLPEPQADALRLRFFGGLKFKEIAQAMQCSLPTAKNRVRWGLLKMGEMLSHSHSQTTDLEKPL